MLSGSVNPRVADTIAPANICPSPPMFQSRAVNGIAAASPASVRMQACMIVLPSASCLFTEFLMISQPTVAGFAPKAAERAAIIPKVRRIEVTTLARLK